MGFSLKEGWVLVSLVEWSGYLVGEIFGDEVVTRANPFLD